MAENDNAAIGVFDSGMGGLTVLKALEASLPGDSFIYLGDTARLPYGTKSAATVERYALQASHVLIERGVRALVVACNTASAVALERLRQAYAPLPVFGVVEPGALAAARCSPSGCIGVVATESTVRGGAYQRAILSHNPGARILAKACPVLVTLAEEGWVSGAVPRAVLEAYLEGWLRNDRAEWRADCLLLGCTHFPLLRPVFEAVAGDGVVVVDSAETTAAVVREALGGGEASGGGARVLLATDDRDRFARVGGLFLGESIDPSQVELVDL